MTDKDPAASSLAFTDEDLHRAVRYLLQLAIEWQTDRAAYEDGAAVLERVVTLLNEHRARRQSLRRRADVVELVEPIMDRFRGEDANHYPRSQTCETVSKWLRRRGIILTTAEVRKLLERPARHGARKRTRKERLLDQLAELAGTSQSEFEKLLAVIEYGKPKAGKLGNELLHERAARDRSPSTTEMLFYVLDALDIDVAIGQRIAALMPVVHLEDDVADRSDAADILKEGSRIASESVRAKDRNGGKTATKKGAARPPASPPRGAKAKAITKSAPAKTRRAAN